jgi:glycerol-3-phosphate dehydrogenase
LGAERRSVATDVDVLVVGAGVTGCSIAASLSRHASSVVVIDRRHDIVDETSKSNTGIGDCGWECEPGSLEAELILRSSGRWEEIAKRLDVPWKRCGGLSLARDETEVGTIDEIVVAAHAMRASKITGEEARRKAPCISESVLAAIDIPDEGVIDPLRLTLGYAELAARNGVRFEVASPLVSAERRGRHIEVVHTPREAFRPRFVVNAAGLGADVVSRLLGAEDFRVWARRGEYLLVDREFGKDITKIITQPPNARTRGVMVVPTTHGSVLLGPTAEEDENKVDRSTHGDVLARVRRECATLVPATAEAPVIKSYAGLRPTSDRNYRIEVSEVVDNVVQACGIRSTGISASPAVGEYVLDLLKDARLSTRARRGAIDSIPVKPRLAEAPDAASLAGDPLCRTVVCACEKVTAREIHDALTSPVPARSVAGVAKRTRATWGRCQGSACLSGVAFITSMYVAGDAWQVPMGEAGATLGVAKAGRG